MMKETICRWCTHYSPDERYQGVVGICRHGWQAMYGKSDAVSVTDGCDQFEEGSQTWLCGEKVEE